MAGRTSTGRTPGAGGGGRPELRPGEAASTPPGLNQSDGSRLASVTARERGDWPSLSPLSPPPPRRTPPLVPARSPAEDQARRGGEHAAGPEPRDGRSTSCLSRSLSVSSSLSSSSLFLSLVLSLSLQFSLSGSLFLSLWFSLSLSQAFFLSLPLSLSTTPPSLSLTWKRKLPAEDADAVYKGEVTLRLFITPARLLTSRLQRNASVKGEKPKRLRSPSTVIDQDLVTSSPKRLI